LIYQVIAATGLLLSIFILVEDSIYKKIRNEIIFSGFILILILTLIATFYSTDIEPIKVFAIRFFIAGIIGVGLWYIKGWSAGDAKLFWLLSLCFQIEGTTPISIFNETFIFLINIFVPVVPVLLLSLVYDSIKRFRTEKIGLRDKSGVLLKNVLTALIMMIVSRVLYLNFFAHLPQGKFNLLSILLIFFLMSSVSKIFFNIKMYILGGIVLLINLIMLYIRVGDNIFAQIYSVGKLAFIIIIFRVFYESVLKYLDVEIVKSDRLRKGDSLSKDFIHKHQIDKSDIYERLGDIFMDGLSKEQFSILSEYLREKKIEYVERQRTFSFSVYMFIGYVFTFLTDFENIIIFVRRLINV